MLSRAVCLILLGLTYVPEGSASPQGRGIEKRSSVELFDDFSSGHIDSSKWKRAVTLNGGGGNEFNMYTPDPANSYVKNGVLYIRPTLTSDSFGDNFRSGHFNVTEVWGTCTDSSRNGCFRRSKIPVTMSALLTSTASIRYGRVEVEAKLPKGDWLWPAIWLMPTNPHYGGWPRSGEIDMMESRGNLHYTSPQGWNYGAAKATCNVHYGPAWNNKDNQAGQHTLQGATFGDNFHTFWMNWTAEYIKIGVDGHTMMTSNTPHGGYWTRGHFDGDNIWASGGPNAPFDQQFHLILNVAVGGAFFNSRNTNRPYAQPWHDNWPDYMMTEFWNARDLWEPTWHGENAAMKIRSVKMVQY